MTRPTKRFRTPLTAARNGIRSSLHDIAGQGAETGHL